MKRQKDLIDQINRLSPLVQVALVIALLAILILIMLYPAAGTALTSFLMALGLTIERFRHSYQTKRDKPPSLTDQA